MFDFGTTEPAITEGKMTVSLVFQDLDPFTASFRLILIQGTQKVVDLTPPLKTLTFTVKKNSSNGLPARVFQGTLNLPGESFERTFSGVVVWPIENKGYGYVDGPAEQPWKTGLITLTPAESP
jgi:hypothetical protein